MKVILLKDVKRNRKSRRSKRSKLMDMHVTFIEKREVPKQEATKENMTLLNQRSIKGR